MPIINFNLEYRIIDLKKRKRKLTFLSIKFFNTANVLSTGNACSKILLKILK